MFLETKPLRAVQHKNKRRPDIMSVKKISEAILGVGVDDTTIDLFASTRCLPA